MICDKSQIESKKMILKIMPVSQTDFLKRLSNYFSFKLRRVTCRADWLHPATYVAPSELETSSGMHACYLWMFVSSFCNRLKIPDENQPNKTPHGWWIVRTGMDLPKLTSTYNHPFWWRRSATVMSKKRMAFVFGHHTMQWYHVYIRMYTYIISLLLAAWGAFFKLAAN